MDINDYLKQKQNVIEQSLIDFLPDPDVYPETIHKAMHYSIFAGGKRLRPILTLATGELFGVQEKKLLPFASALEMIHTYSLIHDDLPALDNDDMRRGKPTNHVIFGEDMAILAGDALLNYAFELMAQAALELETPQTGLKAILEIATASGVSGMIGGQVVDLEMEKQKSANLEAVTYIHKHKTGALIKACVKVGGIIADASDQDMERLTKYASHLGFAFQVVDDILDVKGDPQKLGKTVGKDLESGKATYPKFVGLEASEQYAQKLLHEALDMLSPYGEAAEPLRGIAKKLVDRES